MRLSIKIGDKRRKKLQSHLQAYLRVVLCMCVCARCALKRNQAPFAKSNEMYRQAASRNPTTREDRKVPAKAKTMILSIFA